jgi:hypothetical protein
MVDVEEEGTRIFADADQSADTDLHGFFYTKKNINN